MKTTSNKRGSSFLVQIGGGLLSLSKTPKTAKLGLHIVTAGVLFQEALIIYFFCLTMRLISKLKMHMPPTITYRRARLQVNAVQLSLLLISVRPNFVLEALSDTTNMSILQYRIIYRLVEFTAPEGGSRSKYIGDHEWLVYVFDAAPMFLALLLMNFIHPGKLLGLSAKQTTSSLLPTRQYGH